jgi:neutral ceramidase
MPVVSFMKLLNSILNKKRKSLISSQGNKEIIVNASTKEIFGQGKMDVIPSFVDQSIKEMNKESKNGALKENTLIPVILPVQLFLIGGLAIVGVPGEITTVAGIRVEKLIKETLKVYGVEKVIISSYANSYMGYITTQEEYEVQEYEGGHTVFGQWTLAAFETKFKELCKEIVKPKEQRKINRTLLPPLFSQHELDLRTYNL